MSLVALLDRRFGVSAAGSTLGREILGGLTTFISMAYIAVVNPVILAAAGMPRDDAILATMLSAAFATMLMGIAANLPVALAPGMGLNAFFAYTICRQHQVAWQTGLGLLAIVALAFFALTLGGVVRSSRRCRKACGSPRRSGSDSSSPPSASSRAGW
jgi:AGZA family xanthine/uracil permease-like MFS transporter